MRGWERAVLFGIGVLFLVAGAAMFVSPDWASANFAWRVSPFIAMTIGGWSLGTAWCAFVAAVRAPALSFAPVTYLVLFGLGEAIVLFAFRDRVVLGTWLASVYVLGIAAALLGGAAVFASLAARGALVRAGPRMSITAQASAVIFLVGVGLLGGYVLSRGAIERPTVFPEAMSLFTLRSFGAFYAAIALAVIPLLITRGLANALAHGLAMYVLLIAILAAALWYWEIFDVGEHPFQWIYLGAYVLVGVVVGIYLIRYGGGRRAAQRLG